MPYAEVALHVPTRKSFIYHIPPELQPQALPGCLARVEFGVAQQPALIIARQEESPIPETKPIIELLHPQPVLTPLQIELAQWLSERNLAPIGACLWLMLPPGFAGKADRLYRYLREADEASPQQMILPGAAPGGSLPQQVLSYLRERGPRRLRQLQRAFPKQPLRAALSQLVESRCLAAEAVLAPPSARRKTVTRLHRGHPPPSNISDEYARILEEIVKLPQRPSIPEAILATGATRYRIGKLLDAGLLEKREELVWRDSLRDSDFVPTQAPKLSPDQQAAWLPIKAALQQESAQCFLLHGVTGSGKTEIYLRAIAAALAQGRSAILLVPEIALTPQTVRRVAERFPGKVALVHGSLPSGERYDTWHRARAGTVSVIVGTRSALFTPLPRLGLIVLDEEHDASYKQGPGMSEPHYHARDTALALAEPRAATVILGSATPDLGSWRRAQRGQFTYLQLPQRIMGHRQRILQQALRFERSPRYEGDGGDALTTNLPPVQLVDMRAELRAGNSTMFSRALQSSLAEVLERGEQAILLLNRRGQASYVFCRDCGFVLQCERCDLPLTYHGSGQVLRCHHCGAGAPQPDTCPACQSTRIRYFGAGTQQVEAALQALLPQARSLRWDTDSASSPRQHFEILRQFSERQADILIGTQMIAKGLDLPLVTLVGALSADIGLALPDYRAGERVFQLLTQVAGRAGRGLLGGHVILQSYQPEHPALQMAAQHDVAGFIEQELAARRELGYPPFRRLARIVFQHTDAQRVCQQAQLAAERLQTILQQRNLSASQLIGPAPCYFQRIDRQYRWHLLLRSPDPALALGELRLEPGWQLDIDPVDLL